MITNLVDVPTDYGAAKNQNDDPASIDFLDFLFTVAISVGLTPEIVGQKGLLSEHWHISATPPSRDDLFFVGVFLLGFLNLTLSWFGYHASIAKKPLNYSSMYGMLRFNIDVVLVVLFGVMLVEYRRFDTVLIALIAVHLIFVVWDYLKTREHPDKYHGKGLWRFRREWVSLFAMFIVVGTSLLHFFWNVNKWVILFLAIFITIFYRVNKYCPTWEFLLGYGKSEYGKA